MKLIDRRRLELADELENVAIGYGHFMKARKEGLDMYRVTMQLAYSAERAKIAQVRYQDLADVEKYGESGGR